MAVRVCKKCSVEQPEEQFRLKKKNNGKAYREWTCKSCVSARNKAWDKAYKEKHGRPRVDPTYLRHGLTKEQYEAMMEQQQGICANPACSNEATVIDHDHTCCPGKRSCGKCVVGLLCSGCNTAEGLLESNANKALGLAEYIIMSRGVRDNVGK